MIATMPVARETKLTEDEKWGAIVRRDAAFDGRFVYAVRTTGVYCRPVCGAKRPRRENVEFHRAPAGAERAGFRACKRCKPNADPNEHSRKSAVARACAAIRDSQSAPDLATLARDVGMSRSHFQKVFKAQVGVTPKAFFEATRRGRVQSALQRDKRVTSAIQSSGYESAGRFYAKSSESLGMTPTAFRRRGAGETLRVAAGRCTLGVALVAASERGVCSIALGDDEVELREDLKARFCNATFVDGDASFGELVNQVVAFVDDPRKALDLPLDVRGTAFQQRVWAALTKIPFGQTRSYSEIAGLIGQPTAARAVAGTAQTIRWRSRFPVIGSCIATDRCQATAGACSGNAHCRRSNASIDKQSQIQAICTGLRRSRAISR